MRKPELLYLVFLGIMVLGAVGAGLALIDSPHTARLRKTDDSRLQDLQMIVSAVEAFYRAHHALPATFGDLQKEGILSSTQDSDVTGQKYEYVVQDALRYQLCTQFALGSEERDAGPYVNQWRHNAGHHCFQHDIPASLR